MSAFLFVVAILSLAVRVAFVVSTRLQGEYADK